MPALGCPIAEIHLFLGMGCFVFTMPCQFKVSINAKILRENALTPQDSANVSGHVRLSKRIENFEK